MHGRARFDITGAWDTTARVRVDLYGDSDDHVRAAADLARQAVSTPAEGDLASCLDPRTPWADRAEALRAGLPALPGPVEVRDPDALLSSPALDAGDTDSPTWDDHLDQRPRRIFLDVLLDVVARCPSWTLVRTSRDPRLSEPLRDRQIRANIAEPGQSINDLQLSLNQVDPVCVPIARALVHDEVLSVQAVRRMVDAGGPAAGLDLVAVAVDTVLPRQRTLLRRLASLRDEQDVNGVVGPFSWAPSTGDHAVEPADFDRLVRRGLVVRVGSRWRVPRQVREQVELQARALDADGTRALHGWLARWRPESSPERHHHAVNAEDLDLAAATLPGYASHIKWLGYTWSRRAAVLTMPERQRLFLQAAEAYRTVVRHDVEDAYAWEYLGYNLARAWEVVREGDGAGDGFGWGSGAGAGSGAGWGDGSGYGGGGWDAGPHAAEIERAFTTACNLDPDNPLYRGRWLAWTHRPDLVPKFGQWLATFDQLSGESGIRWFADPVLRGLLRRRDRFALHEIDRRFGTVLRRSSRLAALLDT
ncbi:MAG: hypothetical protein R3F59_24505 [Myxococcota bacterium]